jgi:malate dehydrogenase (oxaloacetate-decarboxylating)(NADP+)
VTSWPTSSRDVSPDSNSDALKDAALHYHAYPTPGKLEVCPTKPLKDQHDLSLAYSPGVGEASKAIARDRRCAERYTRRSNLLAVVTNGTAVLGLGDVGPLAAKPVMEGKAVLFKKFAGIDAFDLELLERDPDKLIDIIASLEPTFGGINLEDIKAPECFYIEEQLEKRMGIPVFHDDQHGTAIVAVAGLLNAIDLVKKDISSAKVVVSGAGAGALSCLELLEAYGLDLKNTWVFDSQGLLRKGRNAPMTTLKQCYAQNCDRDQTLQETLQGADVFLGLSKASILTGEMVGHMAHSPIIFALANPVPEIFPESVFDVRQDALVATGRSDYPNQVNNALCFPYMFRGALDVGARVINQGMKRAAVDALRKLSKLETSEILGSTCHHADLTFTRERVLPHAFDPRLILWLAPAVAHAAVESGVATRPLPQDYQSYLRRLIA